MNIKNAIKKSSLSLLDRANVNGVWIGEKVSKGKKTGELAIVCAVSKKEPIKKLDSKNLIPKKVDGFCTDVVETGEFKALDTKSKHRPAAGGVSIGHYKITAGTLGCYVTRDGKKYVLSNNHVLANTNDATKGDSILQPGKADEGSDSDKFAVLTDFVKINFPGDDGDDGDDGGGNGGGDGGSDCPIGNWFAKVLNSLSTMFGRKTRLKAVTPQDSTNLVDAAIAEPLFTDWIKDEIIGIGVIKGIKEAYLNTPIQKSGRTTGHTTGVITGIDATINVSYGNGQVATFTDQIVAGAMSAGGDSGSAVLDSDGYLVGLLFAGSVSTTVINRINNVFSELGVEI